MQKAQDQSEQMLEPECQEWQYDSSTHTSN